jgi:hypothetical protein
MSFIIKIKIFVVLFFLASSQLKSCDMCGSFMGITPYDNQSNIGLYYRLRTFGNYYGTSQPTVYLPSGNLRTTHQEHDGIAQLQDLENDYEEYRVTEIRAKVFLHERTELNFTLPYYYNASSYNNQKSFLNGLGDAAIYGGYHVIRSIETDKIQQRLVAGIGAKLPTGNFEVKENSTDVRYNALLQPGTGTTDFMLYANYIAGIKKWGLSLTSAYRINSENKFNERAANGFTNYLNLFYKINFNEKWTLIPSLQNYYEYSNGLYINNKYVSTTKMNVLFVGPGVDIFYKNLQWTCSVQFKTVEEKKELKLKSSLKFTTGFTYNFNQMRFPFKKKDTGA